MDNMVKRTNCLICDKKLNEKQNMFCSKSCMGKYGNKIKNTRQKNINKYYENPNYCLQCNSIIEIKEKQHIKDVRLKKFCNPKCSYEYNKIDNKNLRQLGIRVKLKYCLYCKQLISTNKDFCNQGCRNNYNYEEYIKNWKQSLNDGSRYKVIRRYLFEKYDNKCAECGWNRINTKTNKIPLTVDHKDGNYKNNNENNLILLCPNCHSLTHTYGYLNKGKGRPRYNKKRKKKENKGRKVLIFPLFEQMRV